MNSIWHTIYPLEPPKLIRDRQMQVLVLGLSRMGTDSLRTALFTLGYQGVYHGMNVTAVRTEDVAFWVPAYEAKWRGETLGTADFDTVLGDCEAVTDYPAAGFGVELLAAYPNAKVVVNRRRDMDAWHKSVGDTIMKIFHNRLLRTCSWFNSSLFWLWRLHELSWEKPIEGNWDKNGKRFAVDHYNSIEQALKAQSREYIDWYVEEGWEPLCKFLDKPVPETPFPRGNAAKDFESKVARIIEGLIKSAAINMIVCATVTVGLAALAVKRLLVS